MIKYRNPTVQEVTAQKDAVTALFADVLRLNFPEAPDILEKAADSFNSMVRYIADHSAIVYCAFLEDKIVGFLWAYIRRFMGKTRIHVDEFVVSHEYRGQGIGKALLKKLEERAASEGIREIELLVSLSSASGLAFYQANGFETERYWMKKEMEIRDDQ